jgi:putative membrane protein
MSKLAILRDFLYGLIMGLTSTIPGISFGTVAILLNCYEKFLEAVSIANIKRNLTFLVPLLTGCLVGIFAFSRLVTFLLTNHEMITYFAFIGMIIGCTPMIYKRANFDRIRFVNVAVFVIAFLFMFFMAFMAFVNDATHLNQTLAQLGGLSPSVLAWVFVAGFFSGMGMMIPGISGAIIFLMFGAYIIAVEAVSTFNIPLILVVGSGVVLGSLSGVKIIKIILAHKPQIVYCAVLGLILGSVFIIYPGFTANLEGLIAIIFAIVFMIISAWFSRK